MTVSTLTLTVRCQTVRWGAEKEKDVRITFFILNGLIHDVLSSKKMKPITLQFYDYSQMFNSINLKEAISDIYNTGVNDDNLALIYRANEEVHMAVKTANGLSERQVVRNSVLQGDKWGSILASVLVDKIGQECMEAGLSYLYKNFCQLGF